MRIVAEYPTSHFTISTTLKSSRAKKPITTTVRGFDYEAIKNAILGNGYDCSLTFVGTERSRTLNRTYRYKDKPTDVLSFPYSHTSGELIICPETASTGSSAFERDLPTFLAFLFIHGCFHLKGMEHGGRMELNESRIRQHFQV